MLQQLQDTVQQSKVLGQVTYMMGGVCSDAHSKGQCDSCGPSIVAEVSGVGRPCCAPDQRRPHDADRESGRVIATDEDLCHAFGEEIGVGRPGLLQVLLHLHVGRDSAQRQMLRDRGWPLRSCKTSLMVDLSMQKPPFRPLCP